MEGKGISIKRCSVKLNRLQFFATTPGEVQEQILDQRIRRCSVRVKRCEAQQRNATSAAGGTIQNGQVMRRCCIRLPRLILSRSEISTSPSSLSVSDLMLSEEELEEFEEGSN